MTAASIPLHENWSLYFFLTILNDNVYCKLVTPESLIHFAETRSSIYSMSRTEVSLTTVCTAIFLCSRCALMHLIKLQTLMCWIIQF
ncbi:hypothetical protein OIU78_004692 [Salix suchowensis]|nr:hypothetical protein OIU78_004692 [Salix suchowensis]